ncbi:MAG: hypothetical protein LBV11_15755 [Bacillus cereus]|jgi:predicted small secreted protein|nr:hypothetical protein [Bacillus cereus]
MKNKLLATMAAVCLSLTACNSTEQTKDIQADEKKIRILNSKQQQLARKLKK